MAISNGRFCPVKSFSFTAFSWFGVIGMQVRQVAKTPLECFVNGQLCMSTSEPISHSKVWHHVKPPPNHSFVMCFIKGPCTPYSILEHKSPSFVLYCLISFWLMAAFQLIGFNVHFEAMFTVQIILRLWWKTENALRGEICSNNLKKNIVNMVIYMGKVETWLLGNHWLNNLKKGQGLAGLQ